MILLIDNYDSFSYNLYQLIGAINPDIKVIRNDEMTIDEIAAIAPEKIIISPGPGRPENSGIINELARTISREIPTLGVCLGHQAICYAYGGEVTYANQLMHGKQSQISIDTNCPIFKGVPENIMVARYHSLIASPNSLPECLNVTAKTEKGEIMAVQHKEYPIYGVQFHPESILTQYGKQIISNFIGGKNYD